MKNLTATDITCFLNGLQKGAQEHLTKWQSDFAINPCYALEWSDGAYTDAANLELAQYYQSIIEYGIEKEMSDATIVAEVRKDLQRNFIFKASLSTNRTTAQGHNLLDQARVTTLARSAEWLTNNY